VQWKIDAASPQNFLFSLRDPEVTVRAVAESAMREVIGRNKLEEILTSAQSKIADDTLAIMQEILASYKSGIEVIAVNLSRPDVPRPVIDEFQDVKRAEQDKATAESVAEGYRNEILPRAKGDAVKQVQDAIAYKNRVIAEAKGDAARFLEVYAEYKKAPEVTKKRMYLETMEQVMGGMTKVIVEQKGGQGVVPVLPLPQMNPPVKTEGATR
jgi:membrane protease subunit HflK